MEVKLSENALLLQIKDKKITNKKFKGYNQRYSFQKDRYLNCNNKIRIRVKLLNNSSKSFKIKNKSIEKIELK